MIITIITSKCNLNKVSILLSFSHQNFNIELSIAKGTTYPGIDCFNQIKFKLDPVGSTVRYEMMKLCTGSV